MEVEGPIPTATSQIDQAYLGRGWLWVRIVPLLHRKTASDLVSGVEAVRVPPQAFGASPLMDVAAHMQPGSDSPECFSQVFTAARVVAMPVGWRVGDQDVSVQGDGSPELSCASACCCRILRH
jgi:hypothetical protein